MRPLLRALIALATVLLLALTTARVHADAQQDARALFERGVEASRAERWQEARILFERSLAQVVKSSTLLNLAIIHIKLGHGAEALEQLEAFQRVATQEEHGAMLQRAQVLLAQAEALIANERTARQGEKQALSEERARHEEGLSENARREVARAREFSERGNDRKALEAFERAYKDSPRPELLYNIAVVADRLRDDERAVEAYDAFAKALPDARETGVAQIRATALRSALDERKTREKADAEARVRAAQEEAQRRALSEPQRESPPSLWPPRALMIVGGALGAGALGTLGWYLNRVKAVDRCNEGGTVLNPDGTPMLDKMDNPITGNCPSAVLDQIEKQRDAALATTIAAGAAAVVSTAAGAVWLVMRKQQAREAEQALWIAPELGTDARAMYGLTLSGRF
ncbi:MAG: hypothetical protein ABW252_12730 [Polyangiales bacterium]